MNKIAKMIFCVLLCVAMIAGAFWAYEKYLDFLAGGLFCLAVIPSCMFAEAREERKGE